MAKSKELPISFSSAALAEFTGDTPLTELEAFVGKLTFRQTLEILYIGLREGHRKAGQPFELTFQDACDLADNDKTLLRRAMASFNACIGDIGEGLAGNVEPGE